MKTLWVSLLYGLSSVQQLNESDKRQQMDLARVDLEEGYAQSDFIQSSR